MWGALLGVGILLLLVAIVAIAAFSENKETSWLIGSCVALFLSCCMFIVSGAVWDAAPKSPKPHFYCVCSGDTTEPPKPEHE